MKNKPLNIIYEIKAEFLESQEKFAAIGNYHEGYAVILEELDELWDAIKDKRTAQNIADIRKEAIQVGAMALRFIHDLC